MVQRSSNVNKTFADSAGSGKEEDMEQESNTAVYTILDQYYRLTVVYSVPDTICLWNQH